MEQASAIDLSSLIERRHFGGFALRLVFSCWMVTFFDGYDLNVIVFAAPYLKQAFHLSNFALGNVGAAGTAGTLLGGLVFGPLADRHGRRVSIIAATAAFGVITLAFAIAHGYGALLVLRLLNGIALGGAIPLTWALGTEMVGTRYRATAVTLIMLGYGLGVATAGPISIALIPRFGWQSVFVVGGIASLVAALLLIAWLPESLRYLVTSGRHPERLERAVARLAPEQPVAPGARFVLGDEAPGSRGHSPAELFAGRLRRITPLLWLAYLSSSIAIFFLLYWGPILYEQIGFSRKSAAWITSSNSLAGATGGVCLMRLTDRLGVGSLTMFACAAVPLLLLAAFAPVSPRAFIALIVLNSLFMSGAHYGIQSISGIFYPTPCRALGTGWASSVAKIGSVLGPWLGGILLTTHIPLRHAFAVIAVCPAAVCLSMLALARLQRQLRAAPALQSERVRI